jgi:tRNA(Ile)-lysidine synthase
MLAPGDVVGVGVSGGADSVALALLLLELQDELGIRLVVLHLNHRLRGGDSDIDAEFVASFARSHGLEVVSKMANVADYAKLHHLNVEDAGRRVRYAFFDEQVTSGRVNKVAVAHTADDQAETVLAKLIRGTGPTGLAGIYPVAGNVIRPLIEVRRADLRKFLNEQKQTWREDATNGDESRLRARIRARLLPLLETDFQPHIVRNLSNLADLARNDERYWDEVIGQKFANAVRHEAGMFSISCHDLNESARGVAKNTEATTAIAGRLVRRIVRELLGQKSGLSARHVREVLELAASGDGERSVELPTGIVVQRQNSTLQFRRASVRAGSATGSSATDPAGVQVSAVPGAETTLELSQFGRRLQLKIVDWPARRSDTNCYAMDMDRLSAPLILRNPRPGDVYRPSGFLHSRKLKRLLEQLHVSARERAGWPVLDSAGCVAWVRGLPVAKEFAVSAQTRTGLLISEESL